MPPVASTTNDEDGGGPSRINVGFLRAKATYALDTRTNISAETYAGAL